MNNTIQAKFFDGKSSASKNVTVVFFKTMNELQIQFEDRSSFTWFAQDLLFNQYGSLLEIRNKLVSSAILRIDDQDFSRQFFQNMKDNKQIDIHTRLLSLGFSKIIAIAVILLGLIVLAYFYFLPPFAERSAILLPESIDNYLGDTFMDTFLDEYNINEEKSKYLEEFASNINLENSKPLQFTVVESNEVNAFALPNGHVVVYTAILNKMNSSDELVALLGHEASHVNCRHSIKMLCRDLAGYMLVSLLFSDVNGMMAVLAENAQQLHSLSYSRKFEREADEKGLEILFNNHINPKGMIELFEQLEKENKYDIPKIISTHPLTADRKEYMREIISETEYTIIPNNKLINLFNQMK